MIRAYNKDDKEIPFAIEDDDYTIDDKKSKTDKAQSDVELVVIRQQVWELRRKHNMEKRCEPKYLILSGAMYEKLRIECDQQINSHYQTKELIMMSKYMGLTVALIPRTYGVDIIEVTG